MHSLFLSKIPVNEPPPLPSSPTGPYGESCPLTRPFFYISPKFLIKIPHNKKIIPSLKGPRKRPSIFPKSGALVETDGHFQSLFYITFWVFRKGFSLQVPLPERP